MLKVLIIDDAPEKIAKYRELLEEFQELSSDFIDMATSVEDAQEKLAKTQYDLAILDLYLPLRLGDEPSPENAITLLKDISNDEELNMPYSIVGITIWKNADPKYKDFFDSYLLAYIIYEQESDDWKDKLRNKIDFLLKAQRNVQNQDYYDYDVAIINALQSEHRHILEAFEGEEWETVTIPADLSTTYYTKKVKLPTGKVIRIVSCYSLRMASTASATLTTKLIYNFRPRYLFMTGIAAGVDRTEVSLGDILVASKVWDGASGKIKTNEEGTDIFYPDYNELSLNPDIQGIVKRLSSNRKLLFNIEGAYKNENGKPTTRLRMHLGPIASVPAVLASEDKVKEIQTHCRKLLGVEMEGYGVFYASENSAKPRPEYVILIKSVSDFADPQKSDNYQDYCMFTSAQMAKHIILNELRYDKFKQMQ